MKIAIEKLTGNALYRGDLSFGVVGLTDGSFVDSRMTAETCELIDMIPRDGYTYEADGETITVQPYVPPNAPAPWRGGGAWVFDGAQFTLAASAAAEIAAETAQRDRENAKLQRTDAVASIVVTTTSGKLFDGDETSQTRMARAILGLQAAGAPSIEWTLADNTVAVVTVAELTEAMILAGQEQSRLWVI